MFTFRETNPHVPQGSVYTDRMNAMPRTLGNGSTFVVDWERELDVIRRVNDIVRSLDGNEPDRSDDRKDEQSANEAIVIEPSER